MKTIGGYAFEITTRLPQEDAVARVTEELVRRGFGIVTEIDMQATLRKKLDIETRAYRILGACQPAFANRALAAVPHIGVLLPCNVVVWDAGDHRVVAAMEPRIMSQIVDHAEVQAVASEVSALLHAALGALEGSGG